jgi:hypothetical protein
MSTIALQTGVTAPALLYPEYSEIYNFVQDPTISTLITPGQIVTQAAAPTTGFAIITNITSAPQAMGLAIEGAGPGQGFSILRRGLVGGFNLTGLLPGALIYLGDTPGAIQTVASVTKTVVVGQVRALSDSVGSTGGSLALYFDANWAAGY